MIINRYTLKEIINYITKDTSPPLFAITLKLFTSIIGTDLWKVRLLPLFIFLFNFYLAVYPIRKIYNNRVSIIMCILLLSSQISSFAALEIRNYSFAFTFMLGSIVYYLLFIKEKKKKYLLFYIIFSLLASYSHNYCFIGIILQIIISSLISIIKKYKRKEILISNIIILVMCIPWINNILSQANEINNSFWITKPNMYTFIESIRFLFSNYRIINIIAILIISICLIYTIKNKQKNIVVPIIVSIGTITLFYIESYFKTPMYISKYLTTMAGIIYLSISIIVSNNKHLYKLFILILIFPLIINVRNEDTKNNDTSTKQMINLINKYNINKVFYHDNEFSVGMSEYYYPNSTHYIKKGTPFVVKTPEIYGNIKYINKIKDIDNDDFIILYQGRKNNYNTYMFSYCIEKNINYQNNYYGNYNLAIFKNCQIKKNIN